MDWARKRQLFVIGIIAFVVLTLGGFFVFILTINPATCFDGEQNGAESGIDCGGGCELVCENEARPLTVSFAQYVLTDGRPDVIAHITNPNTHADAISAEYLVEVYTDEGDLFARHDGVIDVPNESTRAIFIPRIASIAPTVARAFVTITEQTFFRAKDGPSLSVESFTWEDVSTEPTLTVQIQGDLEESLRRIPFAATIFDIENTVLAVSKTVIDRIGIDESKEVIFTWNEGFRDNPTRVEFVFDTPRAYGDN
mgnify:FL=1|tara:strand:- start:917 stop:1678 length:762 start_codon:yes stop_codon:yes gene_type:complete